MAFTSLPPRFLVETAGNATSFLHNSTLEEHGGHHDHGSSGDHSEFGVHITYEDLYSCLIFLTAVYISGKLASKVFIMPDLVGEIIAGILLGPNWVDFVPNPEAWVLLGELGYVLFYAWLDR